MESITLDTLKTEKNQRVSKDTLSIIALQHSCFFPNRSTKIYYNRKNIKRSEEHTSELQSRFDLVCRLLLEKKKKIKKIYKQEPVCMARMKYAQKHLRM